MNKAELVQQIRAKKSLLCIGLDTDLDKIPRHLLDYSDPIFEFNKQIIDKTHDLCVAYKPNFAFYERYGSKGWDALKKTIEYIPNEVFTIADAKRGDIGNTSEQYAKAILEELNFDSITLSPYMGSDSLTPYLKFKNKWIIVLGLTSNPGSKDFQLQKLENGQYLFENTLEKVSQLGSEENTMFVVGATNGTFLNRIRKIIPHHFLLMPGIGAQGGNLEEVLSQCLNKEFGILINSSRQIIYASKDIDFAEIARKEAIKLNAQIQPFAF